MDSHTRFEEQRVMSEALDGAWPKMAWPKGEVAEIMDARLWRDSGLQWLIGEGFHRHEWAYDSDTEQVSLTLYSDDEYKGDSSLGAIDSAVRAIFAEHYPADQKKGQ